MGETQIKLLTMRQFLFLNWLYHRKKFKSPCDLSYTDIDCFNCLNHNKICDQGCMPASYFYKKINRQYFDCKRVLDSLKELNLIEEKTHSGKDFHLFYEITTDGQDFYEKFEAYYNLSCRFNNQH
ncbi:hypothetical protein [Candidatus Lokiarchaeum ossiferum]|uniref:hypothetical protein n=1 Tax=Candidatus Lokiarchaeum ossiferum TaxID=2951803 RepID=UPI00352E10B7